MGTRPEDQDSEAPRRERVERKIPLRRERRSIAAEGSNADSRGSVAWENSLGTNGACGSQCIALLSGGVDVRTEECHVWRSWREDLR